MADKAVNLEATNIFGLDASFNTAGSTTETSYENAQAIDAKGNVVCQRNVGGTIRYTQSGVTYCGDSFESTIGEILSAFGFVTGVGAIDSVTVNMTSGQYATIDISGHNHASNAHTTANGITNFAGTLADFASWDGFGIPDFGITIGANASPSSASVTFTMAHTDTNDENGDHLVGKNTLATCALTMDFEGLPTSVTESAIETDLGAGWLCDSVTPADGNSAFDTFAFSAHFNAPVIPFTITASGAGTASVNVAYDWYAPSWVNGAITLGYDAGDWKIYEGATTYFSVTTADSTIPPKNGWTTVSGTAPAPTLSY